jgi:hypothetical protein
VDLLNKTGDQEAKVKKIPEWQETKKEDNSGYLLSFQYLNYLIIQALNTG